MGLTMPVNNTLAIDLTRDWTNATLDPFTITRPAFALALNWQTLWLDDQKGVVYCFGGEKSGLIQRASVQTPSESIWGFSPDDQGGASWIEYLGSTGDRPFPGTIVRPSHGFAGTDGMNGYFLGGYITPASSPSVALPWSTTEFAPGLLTFNFASLDLTNDTNVAWYFTSIPSTPGPGQIVHAPLFGSAGILLALGGRPGQIEAGGAFNNISIFDLGTKQWYWQAATGDIPWPRSNLCVVGVQARDNSTFEV